MVKKFRPRAGSMAFYPRKRAKKETPSFRSFTMLEVKEGETSKPTTFLAYKAGMTHILGKDTHEKGSTFGHEVVVPVTILECPPLTIFGIRAYGKAEKGYGIAAIFDIFAPSTDKHLLKRITAFKHSQTKEKKAKKAKPEEKAEKTVEDLEKAKERITEIRLLCHSNPKDTKMGKKKPDVVELAVSGTPEQQIAYAKGMLGKPVGIKDVFEEGQFLDIKAVTKGKGMQGPVKRFGVKMHRPKAKKRRVVGSIGPWNPSTVLFTVARPGQMGYHNRTEINKKIMKIGTVAEAAKISPKEGFKKYGMLTNEFVIIVGSIAGPAKRAIALRPGIRKASLERHKLESIDYIATSTEKPSAIIEEEVKVSHIVAEKEEKQEKKSVQDEIAEAAKGGDKKEKPKEK